MKNVFYVLFSIVSFGLILISCSDDDGDSAQNISVDLNVQMRVGAETLTEGNIYNFNGTTFQVDVARFYLGNISLSGNNTFEDDTYYVVSENNRSFNLGELEEGNYTFSYGIGIDAENNDQTTDDFTSRPTGDPLAVQEPEMHWNWMSGYKFLRIDGIVDTDGDGQVDTPIWFHLGTDAFFSTLTGNDQINLTAEDNDITIRFDLDRLLEGIEISSGATTRVMDNRPLADQLFANYTSAFQIIN